MPGTMTFQAGLTLVILIGTLLALGSRRLRPDLTALCATLALILTNVLAPDEAFGAFGQPVIIIIPSIYVMGAALYETGVAALIANKLQRVTAQGPIILMLVLMLTSGVLSAVLSSLLVISVAAEAAPRMSLKASRTSGSPSRVSAGRALRKSMLERTAPSRLLKSCATPVPRRPIASSFLRWATCSSIGS